VEFRCHWPAGRLDSNPAGRAALRRVGELPEVAGEFATDASPAVQAIARCISRNCSVNGMVGIVK
jgi:hypothetical protein